MRPGGSQDPWQSGFMAPQQQQPTGYMQQHFALNAPQMANVFAPDVQRPFSAQAAPTGNNQVKIPNIRLSFLTAQDQSKFEQLFKSAVGNGSTLSGDQAKAILEKSNLAVGTLTKIWMLADTTKSGALMFPEFALAMYLCNLALGNRPLPEVLPDRIKNEVSSMVDIIAFGVPDSSHTDAAVPSHVPKFHSSMDKPQPALPTEHNASNAQLLSNIRSPMQSQMTAMPLMQTGISSGFGTLPSFAPPLPPPLPQQQQQQQPITPLGSQPTGIPGQWGFVNDPSTGLPGIQALQQRMMPQSSSFLGSAAGTLQGNAMIPWAVTKAEKQIYDSIFNAWDEQRNGYISGQTAIKIFNQSGLPQQDLERIWALADPSNRGKLDMDEFAVAMHLIYRRLNNYDIPLQLPPELTPPSSRRLQQSINQVKGLLQGDASKRRTSIQALSPQQTGISYSKARSFLETPTLNKRDATAYKHNDNEVGYVSHARRNDRNASTSRNSTSSDPENVEQLRKALREKQILLDALQAQQDDSKEQNEKTNSRELEEIEYLFRRIRHLQDEIDEHPNEKLFQDNCEEYNKLKRELQSLQDIFPKLIQKIHTTEADIAKAQMDLFRLQDAQAHPDSAQNIRGTGPNETITEGDRRKAKAAAILRSRMAALTGAPVDANNDYQSFEGRCSAEQEKIDNAKSKNDKIVQDIEDSIKELITGIEKGLLTVQESMPDMEEKRRWEDGVGIQNELKKFIEDLNRSSAAKRDKSPHKTGSKIKASQDISAARVVNATKTPKPSETPISQNMEERSAHLKREAERRMNERLAALGLRPTKHAETNESNESNEDLPRNHQLSKNMQSSGNKYQHSAPKPPPSRHGTAVQENTSEEVVRTTQNYVSRGSSDDLDSLSKESSTSSMSAHVKNQLNIEETPGKEDVSRKENVQTQRVHGLVKTKEANSFSGIRQQQDEESQEEEELLKEKERQHQRIQELKKAREEKQTAVNAKKSEERLKASDKEARLLALRNEIEQAKKEELELQEILSQDPDETLPHAENEAGDTLSVVHENNPFLRKGQVNDHPPHIINSPPNDSTNPFYKLATQISASAEQPSRHNRKDSDGWSNSTSDSSDDNEGRTPAELASLLFRSMAPTRSQPPERGAIAIDSMSDTEYAPQLPPPPPPPMHAPPSAPPLPPAPISASPALLGEIQLGRSLKKTKTKDRSVALTAGKVL